MPNFSAQCVKGVQGMGYLCAFILSLAICVPMSMHQDQFKGRCLLFSTGHWQEQDGQFKVDWASQAYCNFTIFVAVVMFVISLVQFWRFVKFFRRGRDSSFFSAFVDVLVCGLMCIMVLIAALFVSLGFRVWCSEMTRRFETCSDAMGNPIDKADNIDSDGFYIQMSTAQFGIWVSFSVWVTLFVFSMVKLCRYHHQENLRVSMAKERKRLINEDLVSDVPTAVIGPGRHASHRSHHNILRRGVSGRMMGSPSAGGEGGPRDEGDVAKNHSFEEKASVTSQQEHRREPSGGSENVVCSDECEDSPAHYSSQGDEDLASTKSHQSPVLRGNQIRIEHPPDLLK